MSRLRVESLCKTFGGLTALNGVSFSVSAGQKVAVIGPNGAGKSTLFNLITGSLAPTGGDIYFNGQPITTLPIHRRAKLGIGRTFQRNRLFPGLTVSQNLSMAIQQRLGLSRQMFKPLTAFKAVAAQCQTLLTQFDLAAQADDPVDTLAYGQQRVLEIAMALAGEPQLLLLDEPTAGMSPTETAQMIALIQSLPASLTVLIVEHDMDVVFSLADALIVLHYGQIISRGSPQAVQADPLVKEIYLSDVSD